MTTQPLVEAAGVTKRFGPTVALDDARLTVHAGQTHGLVGRNGAGKSTLVSILTGLTAPDAGTVRFAGESAPALSDRAGWRQKVACVYQRSTIVGELTVAENLLLNRQSAVTGGLAGRCGVVNWRRLRAEATRLLDTWDVRVDPDALAAELTVEDRQLVEIARALSLGARFIVLDEPTAQLDNREIKRLFVRMRSLQKSGVTFLYISHHLQEIYEICHTVTVLRDARWITTAPVGDLPHDALIEAMAGAALPTGEAVRRSAQSTPVRLRVKGLCGEDFRDVDLTVGRGEVVGLAGSSGSGKGQLAESLVGLRRPTAGSVELDGARMPLGDVPGALRAGISCVPRDRHQEGLVPLLTVGDNTTMTVPHRLGSLGMVSARSRRTFTTALIRRLDIRTQGADQSVQELSGGNQQKVVMARALASDPRLLVLLNPTAGVDVRSMESLLAQVDAVREDGTAVLMVSDELDDLRHCDRVLVLFHGRIVAEYPAGWRDHDLIAAIEGVDRG